MPVLKDWSDIVFSLCERSCQMPKVVGIRFRGSGKAYHFDPGDLNLHKGDSVIVETAQGIELGTVVDEAIDLPEDKLVAPLKTVSRLASPDDRLTHECNRKKECDAY